MGNGEPDELRQARESARREREAAEAAREEARKVREEAQRLRSRAREMEHQLRDEERRKRAEEREREREERRQRIRSRGPGVPFPPPGPRPPHGFHTHFNVDFGSGDGARAEETFDPTGLKSVYIDQTAGKVLVRHCAEGELPGVVTAGNKTPPRLEVRREGDRVVIEVKLSTGWLFRRRQGANTLVRVPAGLGELKVDNGAGEVEVREVTAGTIRLETGAGEIRALANDGDLHANAGAGKISLHAHRGTARAEAGAGDVVMDIAEVRAGEYRGNAGMGRVELRLPAGHQVHIRATSGIGKSRVEYPSAGEDAPTRVRIDSGIGEASVRVRKPGDETPPAATRRGADSGIRPQRAGRAEATRKRREAEELRVLQMLEQGKITSAEAADLIAALQGMTISQADLEDEESVDEEEQA